MKTNRIKQLMLGAIAAGAFMVGVGSTTANAQTVIIRRPVVVYHRPFYRPFWGPRYVTVVDPIASQREQGYSDGKSRGKDDAKKRLANNPDSHKHYNQSDSLTYREAFVKGYNDGYRDKLADIRKDRIKNGD
jgi:hypothetical protein